MAGDFIEDRTMNNPFDYIPDESCDAAYGRLVEWIESLKGSADPSDIALIRELKAGKMLGVLIATDGRGVRHTLYAFSGQLGAEGFAHRGFVGPVFDYLRPGGYFKCQEAEISRQNAEIADFESGPLAEAERDCSSAIRRMEAATADFKEKCRMAKSERKARRESGLADDDELAEMVRRSQFEKAELHRLKKRMMTEVSPYVEALDKARAHLGQMKERRRSASEALQQWLFSGFRLLNARGETKSLSEIFAETPMRVPPSGAGECCAPKLLQAAYSEGWRPLHMAEYWYGRPRDGEVRIHGRHYPACRGKCRPVLGWMLQGLAIDPPLDGEVGAAIVSDPVVVFENEWFCVVEKPAGMLSVPGNVTAVSVQQWLEGRYGPGREVRMAHRLDQDTSGLIMAAFGQRPLKILQSLFATRMVGKTYVAMLEGDFHDRGLPACGRIELPLSADWNDRPRQRVDTAGGKEAATEYEFAGVSDGLSRIIFHPLTGRTHQLRVHSASDMGLGMPIVGDRLYGAGHTGCNGGPRLLLHAHRLEFHFPLDGRHYSFESPVPF